MRRVPMGTGVLLTAVIGLSGCATAPAATTTAARADGPARLERIPGTDRNTVTLTALGAARLGLRTEPVLPAPLLAGGDGAAPAALTVIPLAALIYDRNGATWTYTATEPLVYTRIAVTVVRVEGDQVVLHSGPAAGTQVVTVGTAELLGAENGVAGE